MVLKIWGSVVMAINFGDVNGHRITSEVMFLVFYMKGSYSSEVRNSGSHFIFAWQINCIHSDTALGIFVFVLIIPHWH